MKQVRLRRDPDPATSTSGLRSAGGPPYLHALRPEAADPGPVIDLADAVWLATEARLRQFFDEVSLLIVALDADGRILFLNRAMADETGSDPALVVGQPWLRTFIPSSEHAGLEALFREPLVDETHGDGRFTSGLLTPNGVRSVRWTTAPLRDSAGGIVGSMAFGVDATDRLAANAARERLQIAVDATADAVVVTDPDGTITYVNPAFERVSGWPRDQVVGANPRILSSGQQSPAFYAAMWATLTSGRTWHGELVNRRRDGSLYTEEATITPVLGADGTLLHYVGVKRDVTAARALQTRLEQPAVDQASVAAMVADLVPGNSPEATAEALCDRVLTLPGIAFAALALFLPGDRLQSLAALGLDRVEVPPVAPEGPWPAPMRRRARHLFEQALAGPTIEACRSDLASPMAETFRRLDIDVLAIAPILSQGQPIGFLQVGAGGSDGEETLAALLPTLGAFGVLASVLLAPQLGARSRSEEQRGAIRRLIERRAFRPVFQPIVALATGATVGFEALTRFADGTPPDRQFEAAAAVGLGVELELATLEVALAAAAGLPREAWLDLNVSPALLEDPARLGYLLWKAGSRSIVLEVTEHEAIDDYARLRHRIDQLGIPVRLAVDDAGAGFASLRHVLELRPDIIKLDRSIIVDLDRDPVRQGLVAGLRQFGSTAGAIVIAEGVETHAECATLIELGVELGQGYLLGRPGPVNKVRTHQFKRPERRAMRIRPDHPGGPEAPDVVHRVNAILWEADGTDERMTFVSEGAASVTGHPADRWLTEPRFWENHVHPDDQPTTLSAIGEAMHDAERVALEYRFRMADGTYRWFEDLVEVLPGQGGHTRLVGVMIDVTDRRRLQEQLAYRATHDSLTGLLNRDGFLGVLARSLLADDGVMSGVFFFDLDEFKVVNDSLGHRAGDELLQLIAGRLRAGIREADTVARFGGDEFIVHATAADEAALVELGHRLVEIVAAPSALAGRVIAHPVSAGLAVVQPHDSPESAVRNADLAMYVAKREGGARLRVFDRPMHDDAVSRLDRSSGA